jgi:hypothetical protein
MEHMYFLTHILHSTQMSILYLTISYVWFLTWIIHDMWCIPCSQTRVHLKWPMHIRCHTIHHQQYRVCHTCFMWRHIKNTDFLNQVRFWPHTSVDVTRIIFHLSSRNKFSDLGCISYLNIMNRVIVCCILKNIYMCQENFATTIACDAEFFKKFDIVWFRIVLKCLFISSQDFIACKTSYGQHVFLLCYSPFTWVSHFFKKCFM